MRSAKNIAHLGVKELTSLSRDPMLLLFIMLAFTVFVYTAASATPQTLYKTPIAVIDNDRSQLSNQLINSFLMPYFLPPEAVSAQEADQLMDEGRYTFILDIPEGLQRDLLSGIGALFFWVSWRHFQERLADMA